MDSVRLISKILNGCLRFSDNLERCLAWDSNKQEKLNLEWKSAYYGYWSGNPKFQITAERLNNDRFTVTFIDNSATITKNQCAVADVSYQEWWEGFLYNTQVRFILCLNKNNFLLFRFHYLR